jgi:alkanesulfonate monooxygenase SsuD/methylene tetrahydromethanopterin reductase-like flavin-dependent oxidoreductase (luciferase family)
MRFGLFVPNVGDFADPNVLVDLGRRADAAGWDGVFVWDMLTPALAPDGPPHAADPWIALAAIAMETERIRLGPLITPVARRRPERLARETVTLDLVSDGRLILGAGLGDKPEAEFRQFGHDPDPRTRAEQLDEGLEVLTRFWTGDEVHFAGRHLTIDAAPFLPRPVQQPRIPIWTAGHWPRKAPLRRAARWDGMFPLGDGLLTPAEYREIARAIAENRSPDAAPPDLVHGARSKGAAVNADTVASFEDAGVTWWLEMYWPNDGAEAALARASRAPGD